MKCEICEDPTDSKIQASCGHGSYICLECQDECEESLKADICLGCQESHDEDYEGEDVPLKPVVELIGTDSNAFSIIGKCMKVARKAGWDKATQDKVRDEMMSGDYDHVLQTAMKYFEVE